MQTACLHLAAGTGENAQTPPLGPFTVRAQRDRVHAVLSAPTEHRASCLIANTKLIWIMLIHNMGLGDHVWTAAKKDYDKPENLSGGLPEKTKNQLWEELRPNLSLFLPDYID
jgi:hypothetical protein